MRNFVKLAVCAATCCALVLLAPRDGRAVPAGVKALPHDDGIIRVKRECIAWKRTADGRNVCVRWAECGDTVC